ncbi:MAG TPA: response regulator, partial [Gemmatimonadaceae bacterium]
APIVLLIDDDPDVIALLRDSLTPEGYRVVGALSGTRGVELAHILRPFVIILDVKMPEKDGWQVLRELKADPSLQDLPVIMMSVISERAAGLSLGVADYLVKPVDREVLLSKLDRLRQRPPQGLASASGSVQSP